MMILNIIVYILGLLLLLNNISFSEAVQVTTDGGYHPRFSPDGTRIAYTGLWNNEPNLFLVDINGSDKQHIETGLFGDYHISWYPDGTKIFFDCRHPITENGNIYSVQISDESVTEFVITPNGQEFTQVCSPDGSKVAYLKHYAGTNRIAYTPVGGGSEVTIISASYDSYSLGWFCFSPDGTQIAYCAAIGDWTNNNFDIYVMPVTGGTSQQLTTNTARDAYPVWSPDGEYIAFSSDRSGNRDIWMIPAKGGIPTQLTNSPEIEYCPDWSPDGKKIAYAGKGGIWVIDAPTYEPMCGDTDGSGEIDILDIVFLINFKYKDGPAPDPLEIGNTDGLGGIDILDIVYLINFKYKSGPEPICYFGG
ncbi:MAG: hypothetical protein GY855_09715 [candidate division Zixibacteria bacterium]|nr:hypothetical protein [candidate division Zixibacteria bacterium]